VVFEDRELDEIQAVAARNRLTVAEWVRRALREARQREPVADIKGRLTAVREAARLEFPTGDIDEMLADIEKGYARSQ
jgi:hypothetical protein